MELQAIAQFFMHCLRCCCATLHVRLVRGHRDHLTSDGKQPQKGQKVQRTHIDLRAQRLVMGSWWLVKRWWATCCKCTISEKWLMSILQDISADKFQLLMVKNY